MPWCILVKKYFAFGLSVPEVLETEHPQVAASLEISAALLRKTGRAEEAAQMEARAKPIRAKWPHDGFGSNYDLRHRLALRLQCDGDPTFRPKRRLGSDTPRRQPSSAAYNSARVRSQAFRWSVPWW